MFGRRIDEKKQKQRSIHSFQARCQMGNLHLYVMVHDHSVPAHALLIDGISSLKRLQRNHSSLRYSSVVSQTQWPPSGPFWRTEKRPTLAAYQVIFFKTFIKVKVDSYINIYQYINGCILLVPTISEMVVL